MRPGSSRFATTRHAPAYADESKSVVEREIRTILEGTRANLMQAGLSEKLWPYAAQHHAMALNLSRRFDTGQIPWTERFGEDFSGRLVPFGAKVLFWNNPKQNVTDASKFAPKGEDGIFLGYHIQPGFIWRQEYLVAPLKGSRDAIENDDLKVIRAKRMELPIGMSSFLCWNLRFRIVVRPALMIRTALCRMQVAKAFSQLMMRPNPLILMTSLIAVSTCMRSWLR